MTDSTKFPEHLLQASIDARMAYFVNEVIVDHPVLREALDSLDEQAYPFLEQRVILLLGGSGVGKTALMRKLVMRRFLQRAEAMRTNRQLVPAFLVEVRAPNKGGFQFSSLYRDSLALMSAALIHRTLPIVVRSAHEKTMLSIAVEQASYRLNPDSLEIRFSENLIHRAVEVACLDEAINIFKIGSWQSEKKRQQQLKDQADKLKTFVNTTPTTLVLAGAYDFYEMTLSSGQNARRSVIVHMEPYTIASLAGFVEAVLGLLSHLPIMHEIDAKEYSTELFLQSLGCVGTLKNILSRALLSALRAGRPLTMTIVRKCYFSAAQLAVMREEMEYGIKRVREVMTCEQLAESINLPPPQAPPTTIKSGRHLAPGETKPSHRHEATNDWGANGRT